MMNRSGSPIATTLPAFGLFQEMLSFMQSTFKDILTPPEALNYAAETGDFALLERSMAEGADVNDQDGSGNTALILAAREGHTLCCELLLKHHANFSIKNQDGLTAIDYARKEGFESIIRLIKTSMKEDHVATKNHYVFFSVQQDKVNVNNKEMTQSVSAKKPRYQHP